MASKFSINLDQIESQNFIELFPELAEELKTHLEYSLDGLRDIKFKYNSKNCNYSSNDSI
ncbi:hypothetical protein [Maribacter arcticus]|uniref:Uncharacterized protein n=1 Tax=Maribacter arcticus TaxID=561365 RepID=A0A1T5ET07_9FLAO|nr:hypothetical protein [Maribacter arcticus]SKB86958.1 hypothetical protein SAMN05660866_03676 [Maribacter arcticus]